MQCENNKTPAVIVKERRYFFVLVSIYQYQIYLQDILKNLGY